MTDRVAHNNDWIFICFSAIICSISQGFSPLFLTLLILFACSGFFPLDLSRPIWFWLSHILLWRITYSSLGFTRCFNLYLIRTELCSRATSNNFCLFEQLSLSSFFRFKNTYFTLKRTNFHINRSRTFSVVSARVNFCMYAMTFIHKVRLHCHNLSAKLVF